MEDDYINVTPEETYEIDELSGPDKAKFYGILGASAVAGALTGMFIGGKVFNIVGNGLMKLCGLDNDDD